MFVTGKDFFASANSGKGFINYFGDIFKGLEHHYIIKGGSGTGKSSLMKHIAKTAASRGMSVEYYHCSSDPNSLDGIIIRDISVGITDGTAPHVADPRYPGACDELINLGSFWDKDILKANRDDIVYLTDKKSDTFKNVYEYLSCALTVERIIDSLTHPSVNITKMRSAADRILNRIPYIKGHSSVCITEGITMNGYTEYSPYTDDAERIYNINDKYGIAHIFLDMIYKALSEQENIISYDPLDPNKLNMIYLPTAKILFTVNSDEKATVINTERFINKEIYRSSRSSIRYAEKCRNDLMLGAYELLALIKELHFSLEGIYIKAMDFSAKEEYQQRLTDKIFS